MYGLKDCLAIAAVLAFAGAAADLAGQEPPGKTRNEKAVTEVLAGKRDVANAGWWGFNPDDATDSLQTAIRSGARTVIIPYMGTAWVVRPIQLSGNQELMIEPGVLVLAKKGEFKSRGDSLFRATDEANITIRGCVLENNRGHAMLVYLRQLTQSG